MCTGYPPKVYSVNTNYSPETSTLNMSTIQRPCALEFQFGMTLEKLTATLKSIIGLPSAHKSSLL